MQRFEGKNLEEALGHAAEALGVERYRLRHAVLAEKRGFLGGVKRVVIEAEVNENATVPPEPTPVEAKPSAPPRHERSSRGRRSGGAGAGGGRRDDRGRAGSSRRRHRDDDERDALRPGDFAQFAGDVPEQGAESEVAAAVHAWCDQVLALAKLELTARTEENETQVNVRLYGADGRRVTDREGELLDALQVLANKSLVGRKVEKDIELDCQDFKARRIETLELRALEMANRVRHDGREIVLPAMSPIERRIVHIALRDDEDVTTESRGEGFFKRVAIIRKTATES